MINRLLEEAIRQSLFLHRAELYLIVDDRRLHESETTTGTATLLPPGQARRWQRRNRQHTVTETLVLLQVDQEAIETLMPANRRLDHHLRLLFPCLLTTAQPAHLFSPRPLALAAAHFLQGEIREISLTAVPNLIAAVVHHHNQLTKLHLVSNMSLVRCHRIIFRKVPVPITGPKHHSSHHTALHRPSAQTIRLRLHTPALSASIQTT